MARPRPIRLRLNAWLRWLHIYTSMLSLFVVLFFSVTGVLLNHPDWVAGTQHQDLKGTLPNQWRSGGKVDWLTVVEYLRAHDGLRGAAGDYRSDYQQSSVSFKAPGYQADAFIDTRSGAYTLSVDSQGNVGALNDFHRGRNAGSAWAWVVDLSGIFLAAISVTGLGLLLYLKKVRWKALATMVGGAALAMLLMRLAA